MARHSRVRLSGAGSGSAGIAPLAAAVAVRTRFARVPLLEWSRVAELAALDGISKAGVICNSEYANRDKDGNGWLAAASQAERSGLRGAHDRQFAAAVKVSTRLTRVTAPVSCS